MTKIQMIYKWSGGCCWQHTCKECKNLVRVSAGKRIVHKCLVYGNTASTATDWKPTYMACKHFDKPVPEKPLIEIGNRETDDSEELPGQISIFDIDGIVPREDG